MLIGAHLFDESGNDIGAVRDVLVEKSNGEIAFVVVKFGQFLGLGSDFYPLPWSAVRYSAQVRGYVSSTSPAAMKNAPRFAEGREPDWNEQYRHQLEDFFRAGVPSGRSSSS